MKTTELKKEFKGTGEVKGVIFTQVLKTDKYYIYKRSDNLYEVFERKTSRICLDFNPPKKYDDNHNIEIYPKSNSFGVWAWCCNYLERAMTYIR